MLELVRYVHLNPVRARLVKDLQALDGYPCCGHSALMGKQARDWQDTDSVLRRFSDKRIVARQRYHHFMQSGLHQGKRDDLAGGGLLRSAGGWAAVQMMRHTRAVQKSDERILGNGPFVERALKEAAERIDRRSRLHALGVTLETIMRHAAEVTGCPEDEVQRPGKQPRRVQARSLLCYSAMRELGMSQTDLGRRLKLSSAGVSLSVTRGEELAREFGCTLLDTSAKLRN